MYNIEMNEEIRSIALKKNATRIPCGEACTNSDNYRVLMTMITSCTGNRIYIRAGQPGYIL